MEFLKFGRPKEEPIEYRSFFKKGVQTGHLIASGKASEPKDGFPGLITQMKHVLIGQPLPTAGLIHERISKVKALAVFASDAISSVAYATEEILLVLVAAGSAAFALNLPITIAIVALIAIVAYSYRQTINHYPQGGGTYRVSMDNFGDNAALVAGASLMIDYVLTAAVSTSAGVAAVTSAFPSLFSIRVELALGAILVLTLLNLRGAKESATIFALPTYLFIFSMLAMLGIGFWRLFLGLPPVEAVASIAPVAAAPLSLFLILRAFSSGCSAMTGVEAVADGVPAFKEPQARNAAITLVWMGIILATIFLGMGILAQHLHILPRDGETVLSQLARGIVGRGPFYFLLQASTALILFLAVNTSFADFPRLASFMAADRFLPRQFIFRGDRLAFSSGIIALGSLAGVLILLVQANVHHLIPLYAVGVFTSFTFSQSGMCKRWLTRKEPGWRQGMVINGLGAFITGMVTIVIAITKFMHGAWMILVLLPLFVITFKGIRNHYDRVKYQLFLKEQALPNFPLPPSKTVVLISDLNKATARILRYAMTLSSDVTALHVTDDLEAARCLREKWKKYHVRTHLTILESPYRSLISPVLAYLDTIQSDEMKTPVTIILSAIVPRHWWHYFLHNQDGVRLKTALFFRPDTIIIDFPFHLE